MSDVQDTGAVEETEEPQAEESEGIRNLRENNKRLAAEADAGKAAQRELAFLRAGVDPEESPAAKFFADHYDGELEAEAIKTAYDGLGLGSSVAPEPDPEPTPEQQQAEADQAAAARTSQAMQGGPTTVASDMGTPDPNRTMRENFEKNLQDGLSRESAYPQAVGEIFDAYRKGDPRVMTSKQMQAQKVQELRDRGVDVR